jgi:hypothetical protein
VPGALSAQQRLRDRLRRHRVPARVRVLRVDEKLAAGGGEDRLELG